MDPQALRPLPRTAGTCPRCDRPLEVETLHLPGWRMIVEGGCAGCGHRYLQDLRFGHGLVYPATLDLNTGEIYDRGVTWFGRWLSPAWQAPSPREVELAIEGAGVTRPAVLLNCLDPVYGHALCKLLNAERHIS